MILLIHALKPFRIRLRIRKVFDFYGLSLLWYDAMCHSSERGSNSNISASRSQIRNGLRYEIGTLLGSSDEKDQR
jgi:hypothetical protein